MSDIAAHGLDVLGDDAAKAGVVVVTLENDELVGEIPDLECFFADLAASQEEGWLLEELGMHLNRVLFSKNVLVDLVLQFSREGEQPRCRWFGNVRVV